MWATVDSPSLQKSNEKNSWSAAWNDDKTQERTHHIPKTLLERKPISLSRTSMNRNRDMDTSIDRTEIPKILQVKEVYRPQNMNMRLTDSPYRFQLKRIPATVNRPSE